METARRSNLRWLACLPLLAVGPRLAAAQVQEVLVSPAPIFDFEFEPNGDRITWISPFDEVWVGGVDPATGAFTPITGQGELVGPGALLQVNGPEWVATASGFRIVHNKLEAEVAKVSQASFDGDEWNNSTVPFSDRCFAPLGNVEPVGAMAPILSIQVADEDPDRMRLVWHLLDAPGPPRVIPKSNGAKAGRWVPGELEVVFAAPVPNGRQAFHYDGVTHSTQQLTFDSGLKQTVFMWEAPEFGGEKIFFAAVNGAQMSQLRVYRFLDPDSNGVFEWTVVKTINPPSSGIFFWSPEPFVHNGRSYIFWVACTNPGQPNPANPTQIWIAAADPADPFYANLSNPALPRLRHDPEVYVSDQGPYVYYSRFVPGTPQQYEGVYRVDTGLGPAQQP
jgi:hypothetical protein